MDTRGLLFIPDISGFTKFVNDTEIDHSRRIIEELLETLINSNRIGLEISEIEGDAILFYRFGNAPSLEELYGQVSNMFRVFHQSLIAYDHRRYCQCAACMSAINLTLKIITHYGEFTGYNVKTFSKLIGKDIIIAHQLLKNDIDSHEYWLVTKNLLQEDQTADLESWMTWNQSSKNTESGEISFHYTQLGQLKDGLVPEMELEPALTNGVRMFSLTEEFDKEIVTLFHATGDFNHRSKWQEGVKEVQEIDHFLPRIGMRCRAINDAGETTTYSSSYFYEPGRIEFSETELNKRFAITFTLTSISDDRTRLTIDYHIPNKFFGILFFKIKKKQKVEEEWKKSMDNLKLFLKDRGLADL